MRFVDYDPEIAARLDAALSTYGPMPRIGRPAPRRRSGRVLALALAASAIVFIVGAGHEIDAAAESSGFGCVDAVAKARIYAQGLSATLLPGMNEQQRQAAKQQAVADIRRSIAETCGAPPIKKATP